MKLTVIERSLIDVFQAFKRIELQFTLQSNINVPLAAEAWRVDTLEQLEPSSFTTEK